MLGLHLNRNELAHAALTDDLTGLPNRRALDRELDWTCARGSLCLLLLDVDGLKEVNDRSSATSRATQLIMTLARTLTAVVKDGEGPASGSAAMSSPPPILPGATPKLPPAASASRRFPVSLGGRDGEHLAGVSIGVLVRRQDGESRASRCAGGAPDRGQKRRRRPIPA